MAHDACQRIQRRARESKEGEGRGRKEKEGDASHLLVEWILASALGVEGPAAQHRRRAFHGLPVDAPRCPPEMSVLGCRAGCQCVRADAWMQGGRERRGGRGGEACARCTYLLVELGGLPARAVVVAELHTAMGGCRIGCQWVGMKNEE